MPDLIHSLRSGTTSLWLFIPTAILLGILHGLEPGHSKTMMAAFIIAIRGSIGQAILLGLAAALSHSLVIWVLAALALHFGSQWNAETVEPYLQIGSALGILALAAWMFLRTRRDVHAAHEHHHHHDGHHHGSLESAPIPVEIAARKLGLSVFEDGVPAVFRLSAPAGEKLPLPGCVTLETARAGGARQVFSFVAMDGVLQSQSSIPEPHEFEVTLRLIEDGQQHSARSHFSEGADEAAGGAATREFQDAHELEHAADIRQRFAGRSVTTPQIILFGITGGLMPCPAAFSVLLLCLQLKRVALGFTLVGGFSLGLAITMVTAGVIAAWSVQHAEKRYKGFGEAMRRAPYISCGVLVVIAGYMAWHGWSTLPGR